MTFAGKIAKKVDNFIQTPFRHTMGVSGHVFSLIATFIFWGLTLLAACAFFWPEHFERAATGWLNGPLSLVLGGQSQNFLVFFARQLIDNAFQLILTGSALVMLLMFMINRNLRPELVDGPKIVRNFLHPFSTAMDKAAKIEFAEVEVRAQELLAEREKVLAQVGRIYAALYHDFNELHERMGPAATPPIHTSTERVAIESNIECRGGCAPAGCTCGPAYADIRTSKAETYLESRNRIRALLDKIASNRGRLSGELQESFHALIVALRRAKAPEEKDELNMTPFKILLVAVQSTTLAVFAGALLSLVFTLWLNARH